VGFVLLFLDAHFVEGFVVFDLLDGSFSLGSRSELACPMWAKDAALSAE
jgi:hypothetical protein